MDSGIEHTGRVIVNCRMVDLSGLGKNRIGLWANG